MIMNSAPRKSSGGGKEVIVFNFTEFDMEGEENWTDGTMSQFYSEHGGRLADIPLDGSLKNVIIKKVITP